MRELANSSSIYGVCGAIFPSLHHAALSTVRETRHFGEMRERLSECAVHLTHPSSDSMLFRLGN